MTKEEILQKVNDYCTEKQYTTSTLTEAFRDKFADHFLKINPEGDINEEANLANLKFALNTAFSSASEMASVKATEYSTKENELNTQIEELKKKVPQQSQQQQQQVELPDDVKKQLQELEQFKNEQRRNDKYKEVVELAKKGIRQDLHKSFETYAHDFEVTLDKTTEEQATSLTSRFQEIFKDSIGDIKPLAPRQSQKRDEEFLDSLQKVTIQ